MTLFQTVNVNGVEIRVRKSTGSMREDILEYLCEWDRDEDRENWKTGASLSNVLDVLRDLGWSNFGSLYDFVRDIEGYGFEIKPARTKTGFHKNVRVVSV